MLIQPFARQLGSSSPRKTLEEEMRRKSLMRQLEDLHQKNPDATVDMAAGRTPSLGPRRGGAGGGDNGGIAANNPGKIDIPDIVREPTSFGGTSGGGGGIPDGTPWSGARTPEMVGLAEKRIADAEANNAAMRAISARDYAAAYGGATDPMLTAMDARAGVKAPTASGTAAAAKAAAKAAEVPKETKQAGVKYETAKALYEKAKAALDAIPESTTLDQTLWQKLRSQPGTKGPKSPEREAAEAAAAEAKSKLDAAEAAYAATKSNYGEGLPTPVAGAAQAAPGRIMEGMGPGGTPLLTNRPNADLEAAMAAKFGAEGNYGAQQQAAKDARFNEVQAMLAPGHGYAPVVNDPLAPAPGDTFEIAMEKAKKRSKMSAGRSSGGASASWSSGSPSGGGSVGSNSQ